VSDLPIYDASTHGAVHKLLSLAPPQGLHPLLVSKMRDERTTVSILNADFLPERHVCLDSFIHGHKALEIRSISRHLPHEAHQTLHLLWRN
jgi:hypothetical protein